MSFPRLLPLSALFLLSGCVYGVRQRSDQVQCDLSLRQYDQAPAGQAAPPRPIPGPEKAPAPAPGPGDKGLGRAAPAGMTDVQTTAFLGGAQAAKPEDITAIGAKRFKIPSDVPGSETAPLDFTKPKPGGKPGERIPMTPPERDAAIKKLYPPLPPLPEPPAAKPGPGGKPYTLAQLQELAAQYSPTLKQAISDVEAARGNVLQARAYPNPVVTYSQSPSSSGLSPSIIGVGITQTIRPGGKLKEQEAAARMALANADLALVRSRSDLSTQVRNAYFGLLVARETVRVNRAVSVLTDEVYRVQVDLAAALAATYEPSVLRAQADIARLAYDQSIKTYLYAWSQLVATIGLREHDMPLSEVAGRIDAFVPRYDYQKVLAHVLTRHTDVLTARNGIEIGKYNLKLQQIIPWYQDISVSLGMQQDLTIPPGVVTPATFSVGMPLSVWDQNKGNIIAAEAALVRALEEPHRVEMYWTNTLAANFASYTNNLKALEVYRDRILPDQVRAYRGVFDRRFLGGTQVKTPVAFADVVTAQQR